MQKQKARIPSPAPLRPRSLCGTKPALTGVALLRGGRELLAEPPGNNLMEDNI
jgi:hypothetical protein